MGAEEVFLNAVRDLILSDQDNNEDGMRITADIRICFEIGYICWTEGMDDLLPRNCTRNFSSLSCLSSEFYAWGFFDGLHFEAFGDGGVVSFRPYRIGCLSKVLLNTILANLRKSRDI